MNSDGCRKWRHFLMKQTWKHIFNFLFLFCVILVSQNPVVAMALLPKRLFFRSTIMKGWNRLWARWIKDPQEGQFTGIHIMVHVLAGMSSLEIMPTVATTHWHAFTSTTLLLLQYRTGSQSWPWLCASHHLMRWRYFILTHPPKCKITQTIILITIKSESEANAFNIYNFKLPINCCFIVVVVGFAFCPF